MFAMTYDIKGSKNDQSVWKWRVFKYIHHILLDNIKELSLSSVWYYFSELSVSVLIWSRIYTEPSQRHQEKNHLEKFFNLTFSYIDDVMAFNNIHFHECFYLINIIENETNNSITSRRSASNHHPPPPIFIQKDFKLDPMTIVMISNFQLHPHIPSASLYCVYIFQLIR